jgi:hypothetical protein
MLKNGKKIFGIGLGAGAFLTFLIVLLVFIFREPPKPLELPSLAEEGPPVSGISIYDFALPDEAERFLSPRPRYFREPHRPWTEKDSEEFFADPRGLAAEVLETQNRRKLDDIFRKIP